MQSSRQTSTQTGSRMPRPSWAPRALQPPGRTSWHQPATPRRQNTLNSDQQSLGQRFPCLSMLRLSRVFSPSRFGHQRLRLKRCRLLRHLQQPMPRHLGLQLHQGCTRTGCCLLRLHMSQGGQRWPWRTCLHRLCLAQAQTLQRMLVQRCPSPASRCQRHPPMAMLQVH